MNYWRARQNAAGDWVVDRLADGRIIRFGNYGEKGQIAKITALNLNREISTEANKGNGVAR